MPWHGPFPAGFQKRNILIHRHGKGMVFGSKPLLLPHHIPAEETPSPKADALPVVQQSQLFSQQQSQMTQGSKYHIVLIGNKKQQVPGFRIQPASRAFSSSSVRNLAMGDLIPSLLH
jgi:hypothetical protein